MVSEPDSAFAGHALPKKSSEATTSGHDHQGEEQKQPGLPPVRKVECPVCQDIFTVVGLRTHMMYRHNGGHKYRCVYPQCASKLMASNRDQIVRHIWSSHLKTPKKKQLLLGKVKRENDVSGYIEKIDSFGERLSP